MPKEDRPFERQAKVILAHALSLGIDDIPDAASMATMREWDSLALMRIILGCEEVVATTIAIEDASELTSLEAIETVLEKYAVKMDSSDGETVLTERPQRQSPGAFLRARLEETRFLPVIGVFDLFSASIAAREFEAVFCSGYGFAASYYGYPDEGYIAWPDMVAYAERMRMVQPDKHIFVDIDDGYGDARLAATVAKRLERVGASAVVLEDQSRPKQCGHLEGKEIMPLDHYLGRLEAVLSARDELFVVARSDAANQKEGLDRIAAYANAGADAVMLEGLSSIEDIEAVRAAVPQDTYLTVNLIAGGKTPPVSWTALKKCGVNLVIYSTPCLFHAHEAIGRAMKNLKAADGKMDLENSGIGFMTNIELFRANFERALQK